MKRFYLLYPEVQTNLPPLGGVVRQGHQSTPEQTSDTQVPTTPATPAPANLPPSGGNYNSPLFAIPWSHHKAILDKVEGDQQKALFFVHKSIQNQWGRAMLENML